MARIMQEEKVLLADTTGKEKVGSDINECSAIRTKQHNIHSKQISSQETSLAVEKRGKHKKLARLDFSGPKEVVYLSSDYCVVLVHDPQIIVELHSVNKEHQAT